MKDGLYRVVTPYFVAGFLVEDGQVTEIAPILRRLFHVWIKIAERVGD